MLDKYIVNTYKYLFIIMYGPYMILCDTRGEPAEVKITHTPPLTSVRTLYDSMELLTVRETTTFAICNLDLLIRRLAVGIGRVALGTTSNIRQQKTAAHNLTNNDNLNKA